MQTASGLSYNGRIRDISVNYFNQVTVLLLALICRRFAEHKSPLGVSGLAVTYGLPSSLVRKSVQRLDDVGLLNRVCLQRDIYAYQPSYPVGEQLTAGEVIDMLNDYGQSDFVMLKREQLSETLNVLKDLCGIARNKADVKINELIIID